MNRYLASVRYVKQRYRKSLAFVLIVFMFNDSVNEDL